MVNILQRIKRLWKKDTDVYFVSGMCYNCRIFDTLALPKGYNKIYIEWQIPTLDESLDEYIKQMAASIDRSRPYILVGYSLGGIIVQEMNKFLSPEKTVIISSIKNQEEAPTLFRFARFTRFFERTPKRIYNSANFIARAFNRLVCNAPFDEVKDYLTVVDPVYVRWAAKQIIEWISDEPCSKLYHIHGTEDQIFPFETIKNVYPILDGDHLMILRHTKQINRILNLILARKD